MFLSYCIQNNQFLKRLKSVIVIVLLLGNVFHSLAQEKIEISGNLELSSFLFQRELPFWLSANSGGFRTSETNVAAAFNTKIDYEFNANHRLQLGVGFFYRDGTSINNFQRNNIYLKYSNRAIIATLGSEETLDRYQGLGVVRNNFSLSGNARSLPGFKISLAKPLKIFSDFYVDAAIAHYNLNDDRFVQDTRVHNKRMDILWKYNAANSLTLGIEHFAQWGGVSPANGEQPNDFNDFIDIFLARRGSEDSRNGDQINALGNSLGYYKLEYLHSNQAANYLIYHHHPFEDGSGTALKNFPDGIWGVYYSLKETNYTSVLEGFLVEYVSTISQSGSSGRSGRDNYFRNGTYRSGWTYEGNVLGLPFISVPDNTRIEAFHLGIKMNFSRLESNFKGSYVRSLGTYNDPFIPTIKQYYLLSQHTYFINESSSIRLDIGYDINNATKDNAAVGVSYLYRL